MGGGTAASAAEAVEVPIAPPAVVYKAAAAAKRGKLWAGLDEEDDEPPSPLPAPVAVSRKAKDPRRESVLTMLEGDDQKARAPSSRRSHAANDSGAVPTADGAGVDAAQDDDAPAAHEVQHSTVKGATPVNVPGLTASAKSDARRVSVLQMLAQDQSDGESMKARPERQSRLSSHGGAPSIAEEDGDEEEEVEIAPLPTMHSKHAAVPVAIPGLTGPAPATKADKRRESVLTMLSSDAADGEGMKERPARLSRADSRGSMPVPVGSTCAVPPAPLTASISEEAEDEEDAVGELPLPRVWPSMPAAPAKKADKRRESVLTMLSADAADGEGMKERPERQSRISTRGTLKGAALAARLSSSTPSASTDDGASSSSSRNNQAVHL